MQNNKIAVKLFVGLNLTHDLRQNLLKSTQWKISRVALTEDDLIEVHDESKSYVGIYLKEEKIPFKSLQQIEERLKKTLQNYLPDTPTHDLHVEIFSKVFVL